MEFPITELLDYENSAEWILKHFHPKGLKCPKCQKGLEQSRTFRRAQISELAAEMELNYKTVLTMRHRVQAHAKLEQPTNALPGSHSETDEMFQNAEEKKENFTLIPKIRPGNEPINSEDTEPTIMIALPLLEQWGGKVDKCAYVWFTTPTERLWKHTFIGSR